MTTYKYVSPFGERLSRKGTFVLGMDRTRKHEEVRRHLNARLYIALWVPSIVCKGDQFPDILTIHGPKIKSFITT